MRRLACWVVDQSVFLTSLYTVLQLQLSSFEQSTCPSVALTIQKHEKNNKFTKYNPTTTLHALYGLRLAVKYVWYETTK